jgi:hypothetical protein
MAQPVSGYLYARNLLRIKNSTTVAATANTTGVDVTQFKGNGITLIFDASAVAGAGSLAIAVEHSYDNTTFAAITGATITVDASGVTTLFIPNVARSFIRLAQTLTGTSVTYSCTAYGQPGDATVDSGFTNSPVGQTGI